MTINVEETKMQLPRTLAFLKKVEELFYAVYQDEYAYDDIQFDDQIILDNTMFVLAGILYTEHPKWAKELGIYLVALSLSEANK